MKRKLFLSGIMVALLALPALQAEAVDNPPPPEPWETCKPACGKGCTCLSGPDAPLPRPTCSCPDKRRSSPTKALTPKQKQKQKSFGAPKSYPKTHSAPGRPRRDR